MSVTGGGQCLRREQCTLWHYLSASSCKRSDVIQAFTLQNGKEHRMRENFSQLSATSAREHLLLQAPEQGSRLSAWYTYRFLCFNTREERRFLIERPTSLLRPS